MIIYLNIITVATDLFEKAWWEVSPEGTHSLRKIWADGPNSLVNILHTCWCLECVDVYSLECVSVAVVCVIGHSA